MLEYILSGILFGTAFICNALMDQIKRVSGNKMKFFEWIRTKYPNFYKWLVSDYTNKDNYLFNLNGWHTLKGIMFLFIGIGIILLNWEIGITYFLCWAILFNIPYKLIGIKK
jgi:hypothetical protein